MRAVFFGTPAWAVPSLAALHDSSWDVVAAVANPDRPAGRGYELHAPPVKEKALELGIEVAQPAKTRDEGLFAWLSSLAPDVAAVVAYGKLIPPALLEVPRLGFVNLHFSLLPAYRGAAPVQRALMDGLDETGVSTMILTEGMDEGPLLLSERVRVSEGETAGELGARLADIGAPLLVRSLDGLAAGDVRPLPQDDALATYAPKITSEEARIDWSDPAHRIAHKVHGLNPAPGAWTTLREARFKVHRATVTEDAGLAPGAAAVVSGWLSAGTGDGTLVIRTGQPLGKRAMGGDEIARGLNLAPGERFV